MAKQPRRTKAERRIAVVRQSEKFLESRLRDASQAYASFVSSQWMNPYRSRDDEVTERSKRWSQFFDARGLWGIAKSGLYSDIDECLDNDDPVLILGETGTGKELVCDAIHAHGTRSKRVLIKLNIAAISPELISAELFGYVKGAFTGATNDTPGAVKLAEGGTLFLDEIGDLTPDAQKRLLRFLQDGSYERVGEAGVTKKADVRIIAATNKAIDSPKCRSELGFRDDFFYRLYGMPIRLLPLKKSFGEVAYLTARLLVEANKEETEPIPCLPFDFVAHLLVYEWPGNVRQLQHALTFVFRRVRKKLIEYKKVQDFIKKEKLRSGVSEYLRNCMKEFSAAFFRYIGSHDTAIVKSMIAELIMPQLTCSYCCYEGIPLSLDIVCSRILAVPIMAAGAGAQEPPQIIYLKLLADDIDKSEEFRKLAPHYSKLLRMDAHKQQLRPLPTKEPDATPAPFKEAVNRFKIEYFDMVFEANPQATDALIVRQTGAAAETVAKYREIWKEHKHKNKPDN